MYRSLTDERLRKLLIQWAGRLAASYVPEWRFAPESADMGSGLALLFLDMFQDSLRRYEEAPVRFIYEFLSCMGAEPRPAAPAAGYMTLDLVSPDMPETVVPAGTQIVSQTPDGGEARFETLDELYVTASSVVETVTGGDAWYIRLSQPVKEGLIALLVLPDVTGAAGEQKGLFRLVWRYYSASGWKEMEVEDNTQGLIHGGIVRFAGKRDQTACVCQGRPGYWISVHKDQGPQLPVSCRAVRLNGVRVRAVLPGESGNIPAASSQRMGESVGFVSQIDNPEPMCGGYGKENRTEASIRRMAEIKIQDRAVMPGDYERLALEVSGNIARVKCFPGYDGDGAKRPDSVTVVVLQKDYLNGRCHFYKLKEAVWERLRERCRDDIWQGGRLFVTMPLLVRVDVKAELETGRVSSLISLKQQAQQVLIQYLDPLTGGKDGKGWAMGSFPDQSRLKNLLQSLDGVDFVRRLYLTYLTDQDGGFEETGPKRLVGIPWTLPYSGVHEITVDICRN